MHGIVRRVVSFAFVYTSASGLPSASVSHGTPAGMLVPRRRTYCDFVTAGMRYVILRNVEFSGPATCCHVITAALLLVFSLKVLMTAAVRFFAASGTEPRPVVVPSACSQAVLRGHSPE